MQVKQTRAQVGTGPWSRLAPHIGPPGPSPERPLGDTGYGVGEEAPQGPRLLPVAFRRAGVVATAPTAHRLASPPVLESS